MKTIVMLQGMGNNERGWARLVSKFGRVILIQQGMIQHVEIWENELCLFNGPEVNVMKTRKLDEMTFSLLTMWRSIARIREMTRGAKVDLIIAPNYSMGIPALLLRRFGKAKKAIVWFSDFLPVRGTASVRFHRKITSRLNSLAARFADEVWAVSPRIPTMTANPRNFVVPICLNKNVSVPGGREEIGYVGIPSPDHALDLLFEIARKHRFRLNIVGDSNYLQSIKTQAPPGTVFYGLLNDQDKLQEIFSRCFCGYAVYRNTGPQSYSYYGIPSKAFAFLASNTPVVTTNTAHFTQTIQKFGVGRVVEPVAEQVESAILQLKAEFPKFFEAINQFRENWNAKAEAFHRDRILELSK